jgi:hypothetical protein
LFKNKWADNEWCSWTWRYSRIPEFESLLVEYSEKRKGCQEQNPGVFQKLTPKPHFLEHYPTQAVRFGSNLCVGTARYEGQHIQLVGWSDASKNFNIVKTISTQHQKRLASKSLFGMFSARYSVSS